MEGSSITALTINPVSSWILFILISKPSPAPRVGEGWEGTHCLELRALGLNLSFC